MTAWRPQLFEKQGRDQGADPAVLTHAMAIAEQLRAVNPRLPPIFTLAHLAHLTNVDYGVLRAIAERRPSEPYRIFRIRKRAAHPGEVRYRTIAVPSTPLLKAQRWITQAVLAQAPVHTASVAFSKHDTLLGATTPHCDSAWLIKMDVRNFFESINEIAVFRVFRSLGYEPLISLELARICTRRGGFSYARATARWRAWDRKVSIIKAYDVYQGPDSPGPRLGHLPQGAPSSPMLANLAMRDFDAAVTALARRHGLTYTRYADDLTFSTRDKAYGRARCAKVIGEVYEEMAKVGLSPNITKTRVTPPGSRKIVLGLLVDGPEPRLTRAFRAKMRQHLHFLHRSDVGPLAHARAKGFVSIVGFRNHLTGLATYARQIDKPYGEACLRAIDAAPWPL